MTPLPKRTLENNNHLICSAYERKRINRNTSENRHNLKTMLSVVSAQCLGYTAKKLLS